MAETYSSSFKLTFRRAGNALIISWLSLLSLAGVESFGLKKRLVTVPSNLASMQGLQTSALSEPDVDDGKVVSFNPLPMVTTQTQEAHHRIPSLSKWKRRLSTKQDAFALHKISASTFLLSGVIIIADGFSCGFSQVQDSMLLPTYVFTTSSLITCVSSSRMAWIYRAKEIAIRNGMIGLAVVTSFLAIMSLWSTHFSPAFFDVEWVSKGMVQLFTITSFFFGLDGVLRGDEMIVNRKAREFADNAPYWIDWVRYVFPNFATLFFTLRNFFVFGIGLSHLGFVQMVQTGNISEAVGYYSLVAACMLSATLVFVQTLRDKGLISKDTEAWMILVISIAVFGIVVVADYNLENGLSELRKMNV